MFTTSVSNKKSDDFMSTLAGNLINRFLCESFFAAPDSCEGELFLD